MDIVDKASTSIAFTCFILESCIFVLYCDRYHRLHAMGRVWCNEMSNVPRLVTTI